MSAVVPALTPAERDALEADKAARLHWRDVRCWCGIVHDPAARDLVEPPQWAKEGAE